MGASTQLRRPLNSASILVRFVLTVARGRIQENQNGLPAGGLCHPPLNADFYQPLLLMRRVYTDVAGHFGECVECSNRGD
jgi:hypothetical protein